jgi:hypothetical protein
MFTTRRGYDLACRFMFAPEREQVDIMREAIGLSLEDVIPICAAAGIYPDGPSIALWIGERCPDIIAYRALHHPNAPARIDSIYV